MQKNFLQCEKKIHQHAKGGKGFIQYATLFSREDFKSKCKYIDVVVIPPDASIGYHSHRPGEEEIYIFLQGKAKIILNEEDIEADTGDIMVFKDSDSHEIINVYNVDVEILIIKVLE